MTLSVFELVCATVPKLERIGAALGWFDVTKPQWRVAAFEFSNRHAHHDVLSAAIVTTPATA